LRHLLTISFKHAADEAPSKIGTRRHARRHVKDVDLFRARGQAGNRTIPQTRERDAHVIKPKLAQRSASPLDETMAMHPAWRERNRAS
jgi:hypothetical protein